MNKIKKILSKLMLISGKFSEYELAKHSGVSQSTINRILSGEIATPSETSLKKLSDFFDLTTDQLLGNEPIQKIKLSDNTFRSSPKAILRQLMKIFDINELELSERTQVSQSTINRMLNGYTSNTRGTSLRPIADFFNVTVPQLLGMEPIDFLKISNNSSNLLKITGLKKIPIIDFEKLTHLNLIMNNNNMKDELSSVLIRSSNYKNMFSTILSEDSMLPEFDPGTILIVDRSLKAKDGDYIIIKFKNKILFRELIITDGRHYIQKHNPNLQIEILTKPYEILGVVIETRRSLYSEV